MRTSHVVLGFIGSFVLGCILWDGYAAKTERPAHEGAESSLMKRLEQDGPAGRAARAQLLATLERATAEADLEARVARTTQELARPQSEALAERLAIGAREGRDTVELFSDYLCQFCREADVTARKLVEQNPGVRVIVRHLPRTPQSIRLALLFEALGTQDPAVAWAFHEWALGQTTAVVDPLAVERWLGEQQKVSKERLVSDIAAVQPVLNGDVTNAQERGIASTPAFVVNGVQLEGLVALETLEKALEATRRVRKGADARSVAEWFWN